ncbi:hypothetical protein DDD_1357 [Nonlabens dokdonensis DSW-6]|uniref:Lipoprotein n=1 Tax=Nonlabens dokdonensis (strain DSM 17205 / KCTC 12402 / DSW-6) TaxID=592029 RepID=L7WC58_NONDD|nr:hypothetical protein DDD_1357 [Nonlabens dokdonensis DSW-6]
MYTFERFVIEIIIINVLLVSCCSALVPHQVRHELLFDSAFAKAKLKRKRDH